MDTSVLIALAFIVGASAGSFINVAAHRLPLMLKRRFILDTMEYIHKDEEREGAEKKAGDETDGETSAEGKESETEDKKDRITYNLLLPPSHCPECMVLIRPQHNIPILSYLMLRGKCHSCKQPISVRYPLTELLTAVLTVAVLLVHGITPVGLVAVVLTWVLVTLAVIDQEAGLLPDEITLPLLWAGLLANLFGVVTDIRSALLGAVIGYLSLWTLNGAFRLVRGKDGMGRGDFKLLAMLGAWLGWQALPAIVLISSVAGVVMGGIRLAQGGKAGDPIPFGPYLAIAGWIAMMYGAELVRLYPGIQ